MRRRDWKRASQGTFLYKLGFLLDQGYTINKSIELVRSQLPEKKREVADNMLEILASGHSVIDIFSPLQLPNEIVSSLSINSANGNLTKSLMENGTFLKKKADWRARLNKAIRYPLFLLFLTIWIGIVFYQFLFPQFSILFSSLDVKTPLFTTWMLTCLGIMPLIGGCFLALGITLWIVMVIMRKKAKPSTQMDLFMRIPILKQFLVLMNTHFFSVNFGSMLQSGLSLSDALLVMEKHLNKGFYKEESQRLQKGLLNGDELTELLLAKSYFTTELAEIVRFGLAHGELGRELISYGEWIFKELEEKIYSSLQKIQPILFAGIGVFVLLMFASMLLPMFKLMEAL
ncbi:competence type IV pilus assembly protein ComGB [Fictibacillus phosphorivorans]|uniref:competence type IV pilus assembly protein ComGB n=1 Tax=Fictibacillus phosphorivorans TaxID=1221500 RepID=UPI001293668D|nr:competence type IV pilus assembly protein ComGB [Fictibacillus phosphorivorans]MQR95604.1 type II secretion system F family protein [Fictibacillus phosphorivorans]